jgi:hypothetical protein
MKMYHLMAVSVALSATMWAQSTAQIRGTVTDASGATISGAGVKATQNTVEGVKPTRQAKASNATSFPLLHEYGFYRNRCWRLRMC